MSDASRHDEIEDVLSSIRRLVAEGPEAAAPRRGRLVLTPALRVPEDEEPEGPPAAPSPEQDAEPPAPEEIAGQSVPSNEDSTAAAPAAGPARAGASSLAARIAELEAVVAGYDDDEEQDGSEEGAPPPPAGTPEWKAVVFPRGAEANGQQAGRRDEAPAGPGQQDDGGGDADASDAGPSQAGPDKAAGGGAEPFPAGADDHAQEPPGDSGGPAPRHEASHAPESGTGAGAAENDAGQPGAGSAPGAGGSGLEGDLLDEAMLREIVAEIVREELQGRLGERITRNVRKLVRQEVNRALTSREFE